MTHTEKCPVCGGSGKLPADSTVTTIPREKQCHGCDGRGWIVIGADPGFIPHPFYPYTTYTIYC